MFRPRSLSVSQRCSVTYLPAFVLIALFPGCGSPTSPSSALSFTVDQLYLVEISGYDLVSTPGGGLEPSCQPLGVPRNGKSLYLVAVASKAAGSWVLRSEIPTETFAMTLAESGTSIFGITVAGSISGRGRHTLRSNPLGTQDLQFEAISGQVEGTMPLGTTGFVTGKINGSITFADTTGNTGYCPYAGLLIQQLPK